MMGTRKDKIMSKFKESEEKYKITNIAEIYSRPLDFNDHPVVFDYHNEYASNYNFTQMYDFRGIKKWLSETQLQTKDLDNKSDTSNHCNADFLYCREELPPSVHSIDSFTILQDPYADSDDSKDKDYVPEEDCKSPLSDETLILDDKKSHNQLNQTSNKNKENDKEKDEEKNKEKDKENNFNYINTQQYTDINCDQNDNNNIIMETSNEETTLNCYHQENDSYFNTQNGQTSQHCEYLFCKEEVFSTCGKCQCFLCFSHFENEDTYNECKKHKPYSEDKGLTKAGKIRERKTFVEPLEERKAHKARIQVEKLTLKDPCTEKCSKKCTTKISDERRNQINDEYISLCWESRGFFMKGLVETKPVANRKVTKTEKLNAKRDVTYKYFFYENNIKIEVCKTFFLSTLGFNPKNDRRLHLALKRPMNRQKDKRGSYERKNKINKNIIEDHIKTFNPVISHYRREHAPNKLYLPSDVTITCMHQNYCEKYPNEEVSFEVYRKVVRNDMNISFAHLGNEECETCAVFKKHQITHSELEMNCEVCTGYSIHKSKYVQSRIEYQSDVKKSAAECNTSYYSVDLQKVIMLPRMDQYKRAIFCPRIIAYNESFVPLGSSKQNTVPLAVVWHEGISGRKQEDIISTLRAFLLHKRDDRHIVLWMDNCSSQNKNWAMFSFLVYMVNNVQISAETITLKYFEPGHTFMSADSFHHQVEQQLKQKNKVYDFADFEDAVKRAGKNTVKTMDASDFYNYFDLSSQHKVRKIVPRVYLKDVMQVIVRRGRFTLEYRNAHDEAEIKRLDFLQKKYMQPNSFPVFTCKMTPRGIIESTKKAIIEKLLELMPENRQDFWLNLPVSNEETFK